MAKKTAVEWLAAKEFHRRAFELIHLAAIGELPAIPGTTIGSAERRAFGKALQASVRDRRISIMFDRKQPGRVILEHRPTSNEHDIPFSKNAYARRVLAHIASEIRESFNTPPESSRARERVSGRSRRPDELLRSGEVLASMPRKTVPKQRVNFGFKKETAATGGLGLEGRDVRAIYHFNPI